MLTSDQVNFEIKLLAKKSGVKLRDVAVECGMLPESFSRLLRFELRPNEKQHVINTILALAEKRKVRCAE